MPYHTIPYHTIASEQRHRRRSARDRLLCWTLWRWAMMTKASIKPNEAARSELHICINTYIRTHMHWSGFNTLRTKSLTRLRVYCCFLIYTITPCHVRNQELANCFHYYRWMDWNTESGRTQEHDDDVDAETFVDLVEAGGVGVAGVYHFLPRRVRGGECGWAPGTRTIDAPSSS